MFFIATAARQHDDSQRTYRSAVSIHRTVLPRVGDYTINVISLSSLKGSRRTRLAFTAVLAILALSGCSSAEIGTGESGNAVAAADESLTAGRRHTSCQPDAERAGMGRQKVMVWVDNSGIKSVKGFLYPYNLINS